MVQITDPSFPTELILEIIERLHFGEGADIANLARAHPRFDTILRSYEQSLVRSFARRELRHAAVDFPTSHQGFKWLGSCPKRYDVVDDLMAMLVSEHNVFPVRKQNMALVQTGIFLLYLLQSFGKFPPHRLHFRCWDMGGRAYYPGTSSTDAIRRSDT